jgi:septal ring factor EnvC (AmiA/AmiB activator)
VRRLPRRGSDLRTILQRLAALLLVGVVMGGCAQMQAYQDAGRFVAPGGRGDQEIAAARTRQQTEEQRRLNLATEQEALNAEIRAMRQEMAALNRRRAAIDLQLADAVRASRVAERDARRIADEIRSIERENRRLEQRLAETRRSSTSDVAALQQVRSETAALRQRREELIQTLGSLGLQ